MSAPVEPAISSRTFHCPRAILRRCTVLGFITLRFPASFSQLEQNLPTTLRTVMFGGSGPDTNPPIYHRSPATGAGPKAPTRNRNAKTPARKLSSVVVSLNVVILGMNRGADAVVSSRKPLVPHFQRRTTSACMALWPSKGLSPHGFRFPNGYRACQHTPT